MKPAKNKRKPYRGSKAFDTTCRNHGSCSYCRNNRLHSSKRRYETVKGQEEDYFDACIGGGDPTDVDMDMADELMEKFGFDSNDPKDMVRSGLFWNPYIEEQIKREDEIKKEL